MINKKAFRMNPVLLREIRVKMRTWRAPMLIGFYNLILVLLTMLIVNLEMADYMGRIRATNIFYTYIFMVAMQFGLITLIAPALTAGAISGERERQTLDILLSTTMKYSSIIVGKLFASLGQMILLIVSSLPIFSIIFLYGSIGGKELLETFIYYIIFAIMLGSIGIFFSTFTRKSTVATVLSYAVILFIYFGTLIIGIAYVSFVIMHPSGNKPVVYNHNFWLMYANPVAGWMSLLTTQMGEGLGNVVPGLYITGRQTGILLWHVNAVINIVIAAILLWISSIRLNPTRKTIWLIGRKK